MHTSLMNGWIHFKFGIGGAPAQEKKSSFQALAAKLQMHKNGVFLFLH